MDDICPLPKSELESLREKTEAEFQENWGSSGWPRGACDIIEQYQEENVSLRGENESLRRMIRILQSPAYEPPTNIGRELDNYYGGQDG